MKNIDEILEGLKGFQPEIPDADDLTERIINSLPNRDAVSDNRSKNLRIIKLVRWTLSTAAVVLVGLFLYTHYVETRTQSTIQNYNITDFSSGNYLKNVYTNNNNKVKINYLLLKTMNYEKH